MSFVVTLYSEASAALVLGKLEEEQKICEDSLATSRKLDREESKNYRIENALHQLARVWLAKGDLQKAKNVCKECLETRRTIYGTDRGHAQIASS